MTCFLLSFADGDWMILFYLASAFDSGYDVFPAMAGTRECWFSVGFTRGNGKPSEFCVRWRAALSSYGDSHSSPLETQGFSMIPIGFGHGPGSAPSVPYTFLSLATVRKGGFTKGFWWFLGNHQNSFFLAGGPLRKMWFSQCFLKVFAWSRGALFFGRSSSTPC